MRFHLSVICLISWATGVLFKEFLLYINLDVSIPPAPVLPQNLSLLTGFHVGSLTFAIVSFLYSSVLFPHWQHWWYLEVDSKIVCPELQPFQFYWIWQLWTYNPPFLCFFCFGGVIYIFGHSFYFYLRIFLVSTILLRAQSLVSLREETINCYKATTQTQTRSRETWCDNEPPFPVDLSSF